MTEELYNKIDKFCNETDWSKYPTYEHALEEFIKGIVAEETAELKEQISTKDILIKELQEQKVYWKKVLSIGDISFSRKEVQNDLYKKMNNSPKQKNFLQNG